jgi:hypothetical protein
MKKSKEDCEHQTCLRFSISWIESVRPALSILKHGRRTRRGSNMLLGLRPRDSISIDTYNGFFYSPTTETNDLSNSR